MKVLSAAPDAAVLVDEAYYDFYGQTMTDMSVAFPTCSCLRTFSKAYGLAGVRIGVLAGPARSYGGAAAHAFAIQCEYICAGVPADRFV